MKQVTNTNWNVEQPLPLIDEVKERFFAEADHYVSFEYDGYKVIAIVDLVLYLRHEEEEETNFKDVEVVNASVTIVEMFDSEDNTFDISTNEEIGIEHQLEIDLKIQY